MLLLSLLACEALFGSSASYTQEAYLSTTALAPKVAATDARHLSEFEVPYEWYESEVSLDNQRRCAQGEPVRDFYPRTFALVEIDHETIKVADTQVTWLDSGQVSEYEQEKGRILTLHAALTQLRVRMSGAGLGCFPEFRGQLLVSIPPEVPLPLLWQVLETANDAGFENLYLIVDDPIAAKDAQASPPRPLKVSRGAELAPRAPELSPAQLELARAQLALGMKVRLAGDRPCEEHVWASWSETGPEVLLGSSPLDPQPDRQGPLEVSQTLETRELAGVWVTGGGDSTGGQLVELLGALSRQPHPVYLNPLETAGVDFLETSASGFAPKVPYWSSTQSYQSLSGDTWIPVVPIHFRDWRVDFPCVDQAGALQP